MENEVANSGLPAIYDDQLIEVAEMAERRIEAVKKIKQLALKVTNAHDWTSQQDKPYLQVSGSEKVARLFGISWRIDDPLMELLEEGHFSFTYKGYFSLKGAEIEAIGTRSSKDGFFKRYAYEGEGKEKKRIELPPSEIDKGDVKKAALTNCIGNGITRLLGIRNLTWEDLKNAGIKKEDVQKIDYKSSEMSDEAKGQREEIKRMIMEMVNNDEKMFAAALEKVTSFEGKDGKPVKGKTKLEDISEKAIPVNYEKVKTAYDKWCEKRVDKENGQPSDSKPNN
jgi:hypothetical protein